MGSLYFVTTLMQGPGFPLSTNLLARRSVNDGGNNQNLILFIHEKAISGAPSINGTNQFPIPPIRIGIILE